MNPTTTVTVTLILSVPVPPAEARGYTVGLFTGSTLRSVLHEQFNTRLQIKKTPERAGKNRPKP